MIFVTVSQRLQVVMFNQTSSADLPSSVQMYIFRRKIATLNPNNKYLGETIYSLVGLIMIFTCYHVNKMMTDDDDNQN